MQAVGYSIIPHIAARPASLARASCLLVSNQRTTLLPRGRPCHALPHLAKVISVAPHVVDATGAATSLDEQPQRLTNDGTCKARPVIPAGRRGG